jgi:probable HAF family extracellular repeat protein
MRPLRPSLTRPRTPIGICLLYSKPRTRIVNFISEGVAMGRAICLIAVICVCGQVARAGATFTPLGDLAGGIFESRATDVSADGSTVVGYGTTAAGWNAFRWTGGTGMVNLGTVAGHQQSVAWGTSDNGSTVVGESFMGSGPMGFRWTSGSGLQGMGYWNPSGGNDRAKGISGDGQVIVGDGAAPALVGTHAFRWTSGGGFMDLGYVQPDGSYASAADSSADGSVVVGVSRAPGNAQGFRWTSGSGMQGLGDLAGGPIDSNALDVNNDGSIIVGYGKPTDGRQTAVKWTNGVIQSLGRLSASSFESVANDCSDDGSIVYGMCDDVAVVWDATLGMRRLTQALSESYGLNLPGWNLTNVWGCSADGLTVVGWGVNPSLQREAWMLKLSEYPAVPEPSSVVALVALVIVGGARVRLGKQKGTSQSNSTTDKGSLLIDSIQE